MTYDVKNDMELVELERVPLESTFKGHVTSLMFVNDDGIVCHDSTGQRRKIERQPSWKPV